MKAFLKILLIAVVVAPLMACQQKEDRRGSIRPRTARGVPAINGPTNPYGSYGGMPQPGYNTPGVPNSPAQGRTWGAIHDGYGYFSDFDQRVHSLVSATMDPSELGSVSGQLSASTGVRFWGYTELASGRFNPGAPTNGSIAGARSELRIVIWDSYAGQVDASGELIPEYPIHIRGQAQGSIQGNQADIYFWDNYGWIRLQGQFDTQYFFGTVSFQNTNGYQADLGEFYIATCSFFRCN